MIPEVVIGAVLTLLGIRSLVKWWGAGFRPETPRDRVLFPLYVAARGGWWLALAAFFFGLAMVDRPHDFLWFLMVPLTLAGVQLVTGALLSFEPRG
jgi:hypothetical protein